MAAQQCRESERLHGIICCYIGFAFFSHCKFQTGNPSRRCALQGSLWAGLAACCHAFLARSPDESGLSRCFPKSGTAEDAIQLSREEVYLLSITMDSVGVWEWEGQKIKILLLKWARRTMDSFFGIGAWNVKEFYRIVGFLKLIIYNNGRREKWKVRFDELFAMRKLIGTKLKDYIRSNGFSKVSFCSVWKQKFLALL